MDDAVSRRAIPVNNEHRFFGLQELGLLVLPVFMVQDSIFFVFSLSPHLPPCLLYSLTRMLGGPTGL
jgi:hypothetical protein